MRLSRALPAYFVTQGIPVTGSNIASSFLAPFIENLYRMAWIVEARDPYTGGHLWRVSQYSRMLSEDLELEADEVARIELGGFCAFKIVLWLTACSLILPFDWRQRNRRKELLFQAGSGTRESQLWASPVRL
jgi:hypothetical protein